MWAEPGLPVHQPNGPDVDRDVFFNRLVSSGVDHVTVVGVAADYCVRWAVNGLVQRGFAVEVLAPLTRGISLAPDAVFQDFQASGKVKLV
jgi:nicotinamidase/pyrazinamidase